MDKLEQQIAEYERRCADLAHQLEVSQAELRGLKMAASLRPAGATEPAAATELAAPAIESKLNGGAPPQQQFVLRGRDLSEPYKKLLQRIAATNHSVSTSQIAQFAAEIPGIPPLTAKRAGDRMRRYVRNGMIERTNSGNYRISQAGARRLGIGG